MILLPRAEACDTLHKELIPKDVPRRNEVQDRGEKGEYGGEFEYPLLVSREIIHAQPSLERYHQNGRKHSGAHLEDAGIEREHRQQLKKRDKNHENQVRSVLDVGQLNRMNPARAECERLDAKEQRRDETCGDAQV